MRTRAVKSSRSKAARRPRRWLKRPSPRALKLAGALAGVAMSAGAVVYLAHAGLPAPAQAALNGLQGHLLSASAHLGLSVQEVYVDGRVETPAPDVLHVLDVSRGAPILAFDPADAKAELEKLPWVKNASVERRLPNMVYVHLTERQPLALWQRHGELAVVDRDGVEIRGADVRRFAALPVIVGDDAPPHAASLLDLLAAEPALNQHVTAAIRVGDRRWNVRLDLGQGRAIDVLLPEENPGTAWARLAELARADGLLEHNITAVDLRLPNRLVVRVVQANSPAPHQGGKSAKKST